MGVGERRNAPRVVASTSNLRPYARRPGSGAANGERRRRGWRKAQFGQGSVQRVNPAPPAQDALRPGLGDANGKRRLGVGTRRNAPRVVVSRSNRRYGGGHTTARVRRRTENARLGGWGKTQFAQGAGSWQTAVGGNRRGTQSGHWLRYQRSAKWKLRSNGKRPVCCCQPTGAC